MKNFEITKIKNVSSGEILMENCMYYITQNGYIIHQIKRVIDESLFTVGDTVITIYDGINDNKIINKIIYDDNCTDGVHVFYDDVNEYESLSYLELIKKPPLPY